MKPLSSCRACASEKRRGCCRLTPSPHIRKHQLIPQATVPPPHRYVSIGGLPASDQASTSAGLTTCGQFFCEPSFLCPTPGHVRHFPTSVRPPVERLCVSHTRGTGNAETTRTHAGRLMRRFSERSIGCVTFLSRSQPCSILQFQSVRYRFSPGGLHPRPTCSALPYLGRFWHLLWKTWVCTLGLGRTQFH